MLRPLRCDGCNGLAQHDIFRAIRAISRDCISRAPLRDRSRHGFLPIGRPDEVLQCCICRSRSPPRTFPPMPARPGIPNPRSYARLGGVLDNPDHNMSKHGNRLMLGAAIAYGVAFVLLYSIAYRASLMPAISDVSLSCALDTAGKRIHFAAEVALWGPITLSPMIFWWAKRERKVNAVQTGPA